MRKRILSAALSVAMVGVALAQMEASTTSYVSTSYVLDVDPARYAGPAGQRVMLRVGDQPRNVVIGAQDEICVQLHRSEGSDVVTARIRALRPEPQTAAEILLVGPNVAPGTYRSTPWGLLLRALPKDTDIKVTTSPVLGTDNSPVCTL
jgi:hypothetical protein